MNKLHKVCTAKIALLQYRSQVIMKHVKFHEKDESEFRDQEDLKREHDFMLDGKARPYQGGAFELITE